MINPKELRIGNWINLDEYSLNVKVTSIGLGFHIEELDQLWFTSERLQGGRHNFSDFSPIKLTGELLSKLNFAKYNLSGYQEHFTYSKTIGGEVIHITALHDADFSILLHGTARKIKSLHDLQNKIFAITGEELEISFSE